MKLRSESVLEVQSLAKTCGRMPHNGYPFCCNARGQRPLCSSLASVLRVGTPDLCFGHGNQRKFLQNKHPFPALFCSRGIKCHVIMSNQQLALCTGFQASDI
jgi:hypothetical protein